MGVFIDGLIQRLSIDLPRACVHEPGNTGCPRRCNDVSRSHHVRRGGLGGVVAGENDIADTAQMTDRVAAPACCLGAASIEQVAADAVRVAEMRPTIDCQIKGRHLVACRQEPLRNVTAQKSGCAGDENSHGGNEKNGTATSESAARRSIATKLARRHLWGLARAPIDARACVAAELLLRSAIPSIVSAAARLKP